MKLTNIEKELFNQFMIESMEVEMLTPGLKNNRTLSIVPSKFGIPGTLGILKDIRNREDTELDILDKNVENSFELNFKSSNPELKMKVDISFTLYYKCFPKLKDVYIPNNHKTVNAKWISFIKEEKNKEDFKDFNYYEREVKALKNLELHLEKIYNLNNDKGLSLIIKSLIGLLGNKKVEFTEGEERLNTEEESDNNCELDDADNGNFLFNKDFFIENECDESIYKHTLELLNKDEYYLYNEFFAEITPNYNYVPINIILKSDEIIISDNKEDNKKVTNFLNEKIKKIILDKVESEKISLNIKKLNLFKIINNETEYINLKDSIIIPYSNILIYMPSIKFIKNSENLKIIVTGRESGDSESISLFTNRLFNTVVSLAFEDKSLEPFNYNQNNVQSNYKYQNVRPIFCKSKGVSTFYSNIDNSLKITTTWNPKYYLPRMENTGIIDEEKDQLLFAFSSWNRTSNPDFSLLEEIPKKYKNWIKAIDLSEDIKNSDSFKKDIEKWNNEIKNISLGIEILRFSYENISNPIMSPVINSWECLNDSFIENNKEHTKWRLFQLCFILSLLPSIVLKDERTKDFYLKNNKGLNNKEIDEYLKTIDSQINLLFFNAGGGKTEAFLAVIVYTMFFERFTGVTHGLTAIIKYPLRLLLSQQTQRVLNMICAAEKVRKKIKFNKNESKFNDFFSLGVWVGGSSTPNEINKDIEKLMPKLDKLEYLKFSERDIKWEDNILRKIYNNEDIEINKETLYRYRCDCNLESLDLTDYFSKEPGENSLRRIEKCPFCDNNEVALRVQENTLFHYCLNRNCCWNEGGSYKGLPFYIVDSNVYERNPTIIISTTDKIARMGIISKNNSKVDVENLAENRKFLGFFGIAPYFNTSNKTLCWENKKNKNIKFENREKYVKFPRWIIQDEAHLLIESLGSFSSIFEKNFIGTLSSLKNIFKENIMTNDEVGFIAATATIADPEKQLIPLYGKPNCDNKICLFPSLGYKLYENFYSRPQNKNLEYTFDYEKYNQEYEYYDISRIYNGYIINEINYYKIANRLSLLHHKLIKDLYNSGISKVNFITAINNDYYKEIAKKIIERKSDKEFIDYIKSNVLNNKVMINYTGNKNINENLKRMESDKATLLGDFYQVIKNSNQRSISGDVSITKLQEILKEIKRDENDEKGGGEFDNGDNSSVKSIFATQSISHGVDSKSFNAMIFHGIPEFINEYIQASARIGRTNVGYVTVLPLKNNKDRLILENFENFHRFIDRPIISNTIEYKTKTVISQAFSNIFISWYVNVFKLEHKQNIYKIKIAKEDFNTMLFNNFNVYLKDYFNIEYDYNSLKESDFEHMVSLKEIVEKNWGKIMSSLRDTEKTASILIGEDNEQK